jgi:predicted nucleic acid-binding protein
MELKGSRAQRPERGILDTSAFVNLWNLPGIEALPAEPLISTVTLAELTVGPLVARDDGERARRQAHLQWAEADFVPLPFDAKAARTFGAVSASLRRSGRKAVARTFDSMIAAIAIANDLPLYTSDPDDFKEIEWLEVVAVPVPQ